MDSRDGERLGEWTVEMANAIVWRWTVEMANAIVWRWPVDVTEGL